MLKVEKKWSPNPSYMSMQQKIDETIRSTLIDPNGGAERAERAANRCRQLFSEERYCGTVYNRLLTISKKRRQNGISPVRDLVEAYFPRITSQLFIKSDQDFCEEKSIRLFANQEVRSVLKFTDLERFSDSGLIYLRLDPADSACSVELHEAKLTITKPDGETSVEMLGPPTHLVNSILIYPASSKYLGTNNDPQIYFNPININTAWNLSLEVTLTLSMDFSFVAYSIDKLNTESSKRETAISILKKTLIEQDTKMGLMESIVSTCTAAEARLHSEIVNRDITISKFNQAITEFGAQIQLQQKAISEYKLKLGNLITEIAQGNDKIQRMQKSISWRITSPFRLLRRFIK